jgi:hypothetical protein
MTMFFGFATEITEIKNLGGKLAIEFMASSLLCVNIFFRQSVKAMKPNLGSDEAMKR